MLHVEAIEDERGATAYLELEGLPTTVDGASGVQLPTVSQAIALIRQKTDYGRLGGGKVWIKGVGYFSAADFDELQSVLR